VAITKTGLWGHGSKVDFTSDDLGSNLAETFYIVAQKKSRKSDSSDRYSESCA